MLKEVLDRLAGRVRLAKLDVLDHPETGSRFGVSGIPVLVLFVGGDERLRLVGLPDSAEAIAVEIERHLGVVPHGAPDGRQPPETER